MIGSYDCAGPGFSWFLAKVGLETPHNVGSRASVGTSDIGMSSTFTWMRLHRSLLIQKRKPRLPAKTGLSYVKSLDECDGRVA